MGNRSVIKTTTNRSTYNKTLKVIFADCKYCPWHRCDNIKRGYRSYAGDIKPNWKLFYKRTKQWAEYKPTTKVKYLMSN